MSSKVIKINDHFYRQGIAPDIIRFRRCEESCRLFDDVNDKISYLNSRIFGGLLSREEAELIASDQKIPLEWDGQ